MLEGWFVPPGWELSPGLLLPTVAWEAFPRHMGPVAREGFADSRAAGGGPTSPGEEDKLATMLCPVLCAGLALQALCHSTATQPGLESTSPVSSQMGEVRLTGFNSSPAYYC